MLHLLHNHTATCYSLVTDCQCLLAGVVDSGDCVKEGDGESQPGDCYCKPNVMGRQCDMCRPGYYNLTAENPDGCKGLLALLQSLF